MVSEAALTGLAGCAPIFPAGRHSGRAEGVRYLLCYNPDKATINAAFRKTVLDEAEEALKALQHTLQRAVR